MDSSLPLTKQGLRNLNSLGPKKKRPEAVAPETEARDEETAKAPATVTTDEAAVPTV